MNSLRDSTSRKALALAIGVLVLGATHFGVIAPLVSHYESTAQRLMNDRNWFGGIRAPLAISRVCVRR